LGEWSREFGKIAAYALAMDLWMTDLTRAPSTAASRLDLPAGASRHAVRHARWHSIFVRHLRLLIIASCGLAVLSVGFFIVFNPLRQIQKSLSSGSVGIQGTTVTLSSPKMHGIRRNGEPFDLTGTSGTQDILNPTILRLSGVDATVGLDDRTTARITALRGTYDSSRDYVWLHNQVSIKNDYAGYQMFTQKVEIDFATGQMVSDTPIKLLLDGGSVVTSDRMSVSDNGHKISFWGHVSSIVDPNDANTGRPPPPEPEP
jgi:lipopolysaccharide export system protein LptC